MRRFAGILGGLAASALLLAGCGVLELNAPDFSVGMEPAPLGYEIDDDGAITISTRQLTFRNAAGALGANVEGYDLDYLDNDGNVIASGESQGIGVFVPAGIRCAEPDPEIGCTVHSAGATFAPGQPAVSQPVQLLDGTIASMHAMASIASQDPAQSVEPPTNWRARMNFYGTTATGADFELLRTFKIVAPN